MVEKETEDEQRKNWDDSTLKSEEPNDFISIFLVFGTMYIYTQIEFV